MKHHLEQTIDNIGVKQGHICDPSDTDTTYLQICALVDRSELYFHPSLGFWHSDCILRCSLLGSLNLDSRLLLFLPLKTHNTRVCTQCNRPPNPALQCKALAWTQLMQSDNVYLSLGCTKRIDVGGVSHHRFPIKVLIPGLILSVSAIGLEFYLQSGETKALIQHRLKEHSWYCSFISFLQSAKVQLDKYLSDVPSKHKSFFILYLWTQRKSSTETLSEIQNVLLFHLK